MPSRGPQDHNRERRCLVIGLRPMGGHGSLPYGGAVAIPIAFAVTDSVETVALDAVLLTKLRRPDTGLVPPEPTFVPAS